MEAAAREIIEIIVEKNDGLLWGRVEGRGNFTATPYGETKTAMITNLKELLTDYTRFEGKRDKAWNKLDLSKVKFIFTYDLEAYFHEHHYLKINAVAAEAGLNPGLVRQYASGVKYASESQTDKIRKAIKKIAKELLADAIL
ncbi:MAG: hypothetical protein RLZZ28_2414 [Bacteroidota bacterium]